MKRTCRKCKGSGLVKVADAVKPTYAWHIFFTMKTCDACDYGRSIRPTFEDGRLEYSARWEARRSA